MRLGVGLLFVLGNPFLANEMYLFWETPPTPIQKVRNYEIGIVLTGMSNSGKEPRDRIYATQGFDRLLQAIRLYKEGKIKKIMISGISEDVGLKGNLVVQNIKRSYTYSDLLKQVGVKAEDILIEPNSKNTYENAQFSAQFLKNKGYSFLEDKEEPQILVITSAFHLRRAIGCFQKTKLKVEGFSTDFVATERKNLIRFISLIPTEEALSKWGKITHEMIGYLVYDLTGKL